MKMRRKFNVHLPITGVPCEMEVIGDTTAMSTPHEIEYTLVFLFRKPQASMS